MIKFLTAALIATVIQITESYLAIGFEIWLSETG